MDLNVALPVRHMTHGLQPSFSFGVEIRRSGARHKKAHMSRAVDSAARPPPPATSPYKSRDGLRRIGSALRYSAAGLSAAVRHEAAFRQELIVGLPLAVAAWWLAKSPLEALALVAVVVLVWVVELLNSAIEAVADAVTTEPNPLLGRAKDLGSAAVMLTIALAGATWFVVLAL